MLVVEANQVAEDEGDWRLEWTVVGKSGGGDNEDVEEETGCGEADEDAGDTLIDEEEVLGKGITKENGDLKHEGQTFHDEVEVPCYHSVYLAL